MDTAEKTNGDRQLLTRAAEGDRGAFGTLYDRHVRPVYWQAFAVLGDPGEAEEVTQDAFVTLWRRVREVNIVDESILPWLLATARFTALNARRRTKLTQRTAALESDVAAPETVEDEVLAGLVRAEIDKAVAALGPRDRELYEMCVVGGYTYEHAASELGVTHAAVRNRLSRLRTRLRTNLSTVMEPS